MSLKVHDPPGRHADLNEENRKQWSAVINRFMGGRNISPTLTPQFYNATEVEEGPNAQTAKVTWIGFPNELAIRFTNNERRWSEADRSRSVQDEYLEWSIKRDDKGKILKVVFCNEGPEYFQFLAQVQPDTLVKLYQDLHPGVDIKREDLFRPDTKRYNPRNKWNSSTDTGTIMHLIQPANTLEAEVDLVARATVTRKRKDGTIITDSDELIKCSDNGGPDRNSDPAIGAAVNVIARDGNMITLENPVGLYIDSINATQIEPPHDFPDEDVADFFKFTRGAPGWRTRLEFEVPKDKGFVLGDLLVRGQPLKHGAQLADLINVSASVRTFPSDKKPDPRPCGAPPPGGQLFATQEKGLTDSFSFEGCDSCRGGTQQE